MELALAALPGVVTTCLLAFVLYRVLERQQEERAQYRVEVNALIADHAALVERTTASHREEIAALHQARVEEVASLLHRIQAPEFAVAEHAGRNAGPDQPPLDLENDLALMEHRERMMDDFKSELEGRT